MTWTGRTASAKAPKALVRVPLPMRTSTSRAFSSSGQLRTQTGGKSQPKNVEGYSVVVWLSE